MAEQDKKLQAAEISKKLKGVLDDILASGDWSSTLFLKTAASKLEDLRNKIDVLSRIFAGEVETVDVDQEVGKEQLASGEYSQVFILLYQVDGADLQNWHRTIKTLLEYGVTRPAYKDENFAREFVRSKTSNIDRNGYVIVNVKDTDFYQVEQQVDAFGHQLFALRENAVKLENIREFVHANKKRYAVHDDKLVLLGEI